MPTTLTTPTHPTRTISARVTCVLLNGEEGEPPFEVTVEAVDPTARYGRDLWRFGVADAAPYVVGSLLELTVPA